MELKTNYQYTYFIYPYAIDDSKYEKYVFNLIKNKKYKLKFFDEFKNIGMYKYFTPNIRKKIFQDFSFNNLKISEFEKLCLMHKKQVLKEQECLMFEYILEEQIQGKADEKNGIYFTIPKIELICFRTGICFLLIKTYLPETEKFSDLLNFNYKFENINLENKNIKKLKNIKVQTGMFNNMKEISAIIEQVTGGKLESKKMDIDDNMFLVYTYACVDSNCWNKDEDFDNIENEFIKLAEVRNSDAHINVDYEKLSIMADSSYMRLRVNNKCSALICSSADARNYTSLPESYENEYLYTYIIGLHQRYYLKKLNADFKQKPKSNIKKFIEFTTNVWITELTADSFGQKLYKRCKEKFNLEELYNELKNKYDIFYKKINLQKNKKYCIILSILTFCLVMIGYVSITSYLFFK